MAVFKCKMCGGSLEVSEGMTVCECEYCGTKQTLPKTDNEQTLNMFNRANHFRQQCEFDKAAEIYERMTAQRDDAELYWSIVLCRYGIEYVDDPLTKKKIPTCHRTQFKSILDDTDYLEALAHADSVQKEVYEQEAQYIDKVQKGILEISNKEKPFDVFICYKETDDSGKRTPDSVLAQELYYGLEKEGFKVFFSRITLESKLGTEYEPYIFAALNSAKVMVVVGTKPEYFNAVWVRNEWSRYLMLMQHDKSRTLIPAYKDMDPYDLPDALSMFQAQDMSKLGFMQDLIRGIGKIAKSDEPVQQTVKETVIKTSNRSVENLLKRGALALEDNKWDEARGFFDQALNEDAEEHRAYIGFLCAEYGIANEEYLVYVEDDFTMSEHYHKACRFGGDEVKDRLYGYLLRGRYNSAVYKLENAQNVAECMLAKGIFEDLGDYSDAAQKAAECEEKRKQIIYNQAANKFKSAKSVSLYESAAKDYDSLGDYLDSKEKAKDCREKAADIRKQQVYDEALSVYKKLREPYSSTDVSMLNSSIRSLKQLGGWKDSNEKVAEFEKKLSEIEQSIEKRKEAEAKAQKRKKKIIIITSSMVAAAVAFAIVFVSVILPIIKYNNAVKKMEEQKYDEAIEAFENLKGYKDSNDMIKESKFRKAVSLVENKEYDEAWSILVDLGDYGDAEKEKVYIYGLEYFDSENYSEAIERFERLGDYKDSPQKKEEAQEAKYLSGLHYIESKEYVLAISTFEALGDYKDSAQKLKEAETAIKESKYVDGLEYLELKHYNNAIQCFGELENYRDSAEKLEQAKNEFDAILAKMVGMYNTQSVVSASYNHTVGLKKDGTTIATKSIGNGQFDGSDWQNIVAVSAGDDFSVGLKNDGTVVASGNNSSGQCNVSDWKDIVAVSAGVRHTIGLKKDGTVVATGDNGDGQCNVLGWKDMVYVSAGKNHTVGLRANGTVIAVSNNNSEKLNVSYWKDIVAVSAGVWHTIGLKKDGTVVAAGDSSYGKCDISSWKDIVAISAGNEHTIGLKKDGTVVAAGDNSKGQCNVSGWKDIVAVSAGENYTIGVKKDGTVVATGDNIFGQCNVSGWKDIKTS